MRTVYQEKNAGNPAMLILKCLLFSYVVTGTILMILTFALYRFGISQNVVKAVIIVTYVMSNFAGGYIAGKRMNSRKYFWGLLLGIVYFAVLAVMSLIVNHSVSALGNSFFSAFILCAGGGMLGGMLS